MAENEPLYALLEIMLHTFSSHVTKPLPTKPLPKPGGHPEEIFVNLSEQEKDEFECAICYQILKDVRECENRHKFCNSCIDVWSYSGSQINHSRCPVCRSFGNYISNEELDERINEKLVKCSLATCKWKGKLKLYGTHQHSTYSTTGASKEITTDFPAVQNNVQKCPSSNSHIHSNSSVLQNLVTSLDTGSRTNLASQRQLQAGNQSNSNNVSGSSNIQTTSSVNQRGPQRQNNGQTTPRARARNRSRLNPSSPQRHSNVTATGHTNRLTSRARIQNGIVQSESHNIATTDLNSEQNENRSTTEHTVMETIMIPHPPTTPRTQRQTPRRLPTLPALTNHNRFNSVNVSTDSNNNVRETGIDTDMMSPDIVTPRNRLTGESTIERPWQPQSFSIIRERLNESRQRLDLLMSVFSNELDRGRQDISLFQEERDRRRQEQLVEVRELGRRLTHVAQELRGLLSQRHQIRTQIDSRVESASDDQQES